MTALSIDAISVMRPEVPLNLIANHEEVGCSKFNAHILKKMMGIESVNYLNGASHSTREILKKIGESQILQHIETSDVCFWGVNTGARRSRYGSTLNRLPVRRANRGNTASYKGSSFMGMSNANRCVSLFKVISNIDRLQEDSRTHVIDTSELAFSDEMRITRGLSVQGDAACLMVLSKSDKPKIRVCSSHMHYDAQFNKGIWCEAEEIQSYENRYRENIKNVVDQVLKSSGISLTDVDVVLPHNINAKSWKYLCEFLDIPEERFYGDNIKTNGHCFCNDFIINLSDFLMSVVNSQYLMAVAAGAGGMFGACVLEVVDETGFCNERHYI